MKKNHITFVFVVLSLILLTFAGCSGSIESFDEPRTEVAGSGNENEDTEVSDGDANAEDAKEIGASDEDGFTEDGEVEESVDTEDTVEPEEITDPEENVDTDEAIEDSEEEDTDDGQDTELAGFTVYDRDMNEMTLKSLIGDNKVTMLNFWGTFCGPCISEMPELAKIESDYRDKGFEIVGVTTDAVDYDRGDLDPTVIKNAEMIMEETGVGYPVVFAYPDLIDYIGVYAVPTTVFVDRHGNILGEPIIGARNRQAWESIIDKLFL